MIEINNTKGTAQATYERLKTARDPYLRRARDCSLVTLPSLIPPDGHSGSSDLYKPFQAIGASCVNNLASKLVLTLFPPGSRFFRLVPSQTVKAQVGDDAAQQELERGLAKVEMIILKKIETLGVRSVAYEAVRHLIVGGNGLVYVDSKHSQFFSLNSYVVRRDPEGNLAEIVVEETIAPSALPESFRAKVQDQLTKEEREQDKSVTIYTWVRKDENGQWFQTQEVKGIEVDGTRKTYGKRHLPWLVLRWSRDKNEEYGRGLCDDHYGDLVACETLSRSIQRYALIAAKTVFMVKSGSTTDLKDLEQAPEGGFVEVFNLDDIKPLSLEKSQDFGTAYQVLSDLKRDLSLAFLKNSAIQRSGERVTAEEIRYMASELEDALGGVYSLLSVDFQLGLVKAVMSILQASNDLPVLPEKSIDPTIVTGIDALGRSHETNRLSLFIRGIREELGEQALQYINVEEYLKRKATGLGIENEEALVKTSEEIQQEAAMAQMRQMAEKLGGPAIKAMSDNNMAQMQ